MRYEIDTTMMGPDWTCPPAVLESLVEDLNWEADRRGWPVRFAVANKANNPQEVRELLPQEFEQVFWELTDTHNRASGAAPQAIRATRLPSLR